MRIRFQHHGPPMRPHSSRDDCGIRVSHMRCEAPHGRQKRHERLQIMSEMQLPLSLQRIPSPCTILHQSSSLERHAPISVWSRTESTKQKTDHGKPEYGIELHTPYLTNPSTRPTLYATPTPLSRHPACGIRTSHSIWASYASKRGE